MNRSTKPLRNHQNMRPIKAKHREICRLCQNLIKPGEKIFGGKKARHVTCTKPPLTVEQQDRLLNQLSQQDYLRKARQAGKDYLKARDTRISELKKISGRPIVVIKKSQ